MLAIILTGIAQIGGILLQLYVWAIIIAAVLSWLITFNVVNPYQPLVQFILSFTRAIIEPALRPIRRWVPPLGGVDISPIILILVIQFLVIPLWYHFFGIMISAVQSGSNAAAL